MAKTVIIDSGPIVAALRQRDLHHDGAAILTTDSDFRTYRKNGRQVIPLMMPADS